MNLKTAHLICFLIGLLILHFGGCRRQSETSWINPPARGYHAMAYDSESDKVILFSGQTGPYDDPKSLNNETWVYDPQTNEWQEMKPASTPPAIYCNALAYDEESDRIIMYSGILFHDSTYTLVRDTWAYDYNSNKWARMSDGPPGRFGHNIVYDSESDRIIMFSGAYMDNGVQHYNDLWTYDFNTDRWKEMKPERMPPPRHYYQMTYDSQADRVVIWSGWIYNAEDKNVWTYDVNTNTWSEKEDIPCPEPGGYGSIAYDVQSDRVILYGGLHNGRHETWIYSLKNNTWTKMSPLLIPGQLSRLDMVYCQSIDRVLLFGGQKDSRQFVYSDQTWAYDFNTDSWENKKVLKGPYLGQQPPGFEPECFAPGFVSSPFMEHSPVVFSADGKELYWSPDFRDFGTSGAVILTMRMEKNQWTSPQKASFSKPYLDYNPVLSHDGKRLFFLSNRLYSQETESKDLDFWMTKRTRNGWSEPEIVEMENRPGYLMTQFSISHDDTLYFSSSDNYEINSWDIYRAYWEEGRFVRTERLDEPINTSYWETYPFIAPDESYLIFTSRDRPDGFGGMDLYISFRTKDESWTEPKNMGDRVNTKFVETFASLSPDGKFLFFASSRDGNVDMYWVDARIIEDLKPKELKQ